jgi:ketosteroid isomerase-like protein
VAEARVHFRLGRRGTLLERLIVRYPSVSRAAWTTLTRLPHGRLRRALVSDFLRRGYEAWAEGGMDAIVHMLDPQIEWDLSNWADWPEDVYYGHDGFRRFWADYLSVWEEVEFIFDGIIEAGDNQIVVFLRQHALGKASGIQVHSPSYAQIATVRGERITRLAFYSNRDEALAAVGLMGNANSQTPGTPGDMPNVVVTRVPHAVRRRSRNLEERIYVRFPFVLRRLAALVFRLSPRSRLRRVLLRRAFVSGWASFQRRDFELNCLFFAPDAVFEFPFGMQTLGLSGSYRGYAGRIEANNKLYEVWGSELEPAYLLDLGERLLNLGFWHTHARASGIPLVQELAQLVTLRDGLVVRDQTFLSWDEGMQAAGLDPDAIALPKRAETDQVASIRS